MGHFKPYKKIQKKISAINRPDYYNDLDKIYLKIWDLLKSGLDNRDAQFQRPLTDHEHASYNGYDKIHSPLQTILRDKNQQMGAI